MHVQVRIQFLRIAISTVQAVNNMKECSLHKQELVNVIYFFLYMVTHYGGMVESAYAPG